MINFFIERPVFASTMAIVMVLAGAICLRLLPVSQFPEITPPQIVVKATYPGASAQVVADTVTTPLEQQINGVPGMIYMSSVSANDGTSTVTITFEVGYPPDIAAVDVQNRVSQAASQLPPIVNQGGVTITKQNPNFVVVVNLFSPDDSIDLVTLSNYAYLQIVDPLKRLPGVSDVSILGERRYSMRVWLDPDKLAKLGITAVDVQNAIAEQNVQVAAGKLGDDPAPPRHGLQLSDQHPRKVERPGAIQRHRAARRNRERGDAAPARRRADRARRAAIQFDRLPQRQAKRPLGRLPAADGQLPRAAKPDHDPDGGAVEAVPQRPALRHGVRHHPFRVGIDPRRHDHARRGDAARFLRGLCVPAELADHADSRHRHPGLADRHAGGDEGGRLLDQYGQPARHGAGRRTRGRRCHRGRRERRAAAGGRACAARGGQKGDARGDRPDHRDDGGADGRVRAGRLPARHHRAALQPVRVDHRHIDGPVGDQLAHAQSGSVRGVPQPPRRTALCALSQIQRRLQSASPRLRERRAPRDRRALAGARHLRGRACAGVRHLFAHSHCVSPGRGPGLFLRRHPASRRLIAAAHRRRCRARAQDIARRRGRRRCRHDQRAQLCDAGEPAEFRGGVRDPQAVGRAGERVDRGQDPRLGAAKASRHTGGDRARLRAAVDPRPRHVWRV